MTLFFWRDNHRSDSSLLVLYVDSQDVHTHTCLHTIIKVHLLGFNVHFCELLLTKLPSHFKGFFVQLAALVIASAIEGGFFFTETAICEYKEAE